MKKWFMEIRLSIIALLFYPFLLLAQSPKDTLTARQIKHSFSQTGLQRTHPRLFFDRSDIMRVKKLLKEGDPIVTLAYDSLFARARAVLADSLQTYGLDAAGLRILSIHNFAAQLPALVMMYQLTGDTAYAARAWQQLAIFNRYPDWGADRHFLDAGIGGFNFALAYDGLYDYLSEAQKKAMRDAVRKNVLQPARLQMPKKVFWWVAPHNWNGICDGGVIMASLAMMEDDPEAMSQLVAMAANGLPNYLHSFEPDGQSEEGMSYWTYGLMYTTIALESMQRVLGTDYGLSQIPGFKKTGWFPLYTAGPVASVSFGDDHVKNSRTNSFFWFARQYRDSALAKLQYDLCVENKSATWMDMIYYEPALIAQNSVVSSLPRDTYVRGCDIMALREDWGRDGIFISMHGGRNTANHAHLDAGSFDIQGLGEIWANGNLGSDNYNFPGYFNQTPVPHYRDVPVPPVAPGRFHFYRIRAEGKNCLVINPSTAPDQDPRGAAKLVNRHSGSDLGFFIADLQNCYSRDASRYLRGIRMDKKNGVISVQDDVVMMKPSTIWWSMHTGAEIRLQKGGRRAELKIGNKELIAEIISPETASFQSLPASYLPGQEFPLTKNSPNTEFSKLAIKLEGVYQTIIRVDFYEAANQRRAVVPLQPLADWDNRHKK